MARIPTEDRPNRIRHVIFEDLKRGRGSRLTAKQAFVQSQLVVVRARDLALLLTQQEKDLLTDIADVIDNLQCYWEEEKE